MKPPTPPDTLQDRRNVQKLPSIKSEWKPGQEFVPASARGERSAQPSAVPSLPSVTTPSFPGNYLQKLSNWATGRSTQNGDDIHEWGHSKQNGGEGKAKGRQKEKAKKWKPESVRAGKPRSKAVVSAAEALGRTNPTAGQACSDKLALAQQNINSPGGLHVPTPSPEPRSNSATPIVSPGAKSNGVSESFSRTIRRPRPKSVSAVSEHDPIVSPSGGGVPTPSVLQPRASARSSMPPQSSRFFKPRSSVPPPISTSRVSMPPLRLQQPSQNGRERLSMPPSSARSAWTVGSPPVLAAPPPTAVVPREQTESQQPQQQNQQLQAPESQQLQQQQQTPELQHPQPMPYHQAQDLLHVPSAQHSPCPPSQPSPYLLAQHSPHPAPFQHSPFLQPQHSPYLPSAQHSSYPPSAQHSPYSQITQDHQLPPNQYQPQYQPHDPYLVHQYPPPQHVEHGYVMIPPQGPINAFPLSPMSPSAIPFSPYPEQGYLPPMPPMSPIGPCFGTPAQPQQAWRTEAAPPTQPTGQPSSNRGPRFQRPWYARRQQK